MIEKKTGIFVTNNDNEVYMCGDIHGDYQCLIHCLVDLCKVCEITKVDDDDEFGTPNREYLSWIKESNSVIIFCGDLIHRKRFQDHVLDDECSDIFIIQMLLRLKEEAKENGGDIIIIAGNHEILNILDPDNTMYTSNFNIDSNDKYFNSQKFINEYISNSYAWIKINDILVAHGGLCSDYLRYLDEQNIFEEKIYPNEQIGGNKNGNRNDYKNKYIKNNIQYHLIGGRSVEEGDGIIEFVNDKYRSFFTNLNKEELEKDIISYNLFVKYDVVNKNRLNMFWCREWGYSGVDCEKFKTILNKVGCNKMVIAHCPQFVSPDYPKMINFECIDIDTTNEDLESFNIARIDLGMSRSFDYNKDDNFLYYLANNYNRKMSVLKLQIDKSTNKVIFNTDSIITLKLSCIQYLLLKYGLTKENWKEYSIDSNWLGFEYLKKVLGEKNIKSLENSICSCKQSCKKLNIVTNKSKTSKTFVEKNNNKDKMNPEQTILCLLDPILNCNLKLNSIEQYRECFNQD